jgi:succinylglutamate desuccinylase
MTSPLSDTGVEAVVLRERQMEIALRSLSSAARAVLATLKPGQSLPCGAALTNRLDSICSEVEAALSQHREANHSDKLKEGLQSAVRSVQSRPPELRGSFKSDRQS